MSSIFGSQQLRCGPINGRFGERERIKYYCIQAEICEKSSWGQSGTDQNV